MTERPFTAAAQALVRWHEAHGAAGEPPASAAARACEGLVQHLAGFVGEAGARALFERSLALAQHRHPQLGAARAAPGSAPGRSCASAWRRRGPRRARRRRRCWRPSSRSSPT